MTPDLTRTDLCIAATPSFRTAGWTIVLGILVASAAGAILLDRGPQAMAMDPGTQHAAHLHDTTSAEAAGGATRVDPTQGPSLYVLDHAWTDQTGRTLTLEDLRGRPRVVAMVYTHCSYACPRILARMKQIEAAFTDLPAERAPGMVLVSIDPLRDTPGRLAEFAASARLDPERWTLLTGPDDAVLELSVLLDVKYRATGAGEFSHANVLTVLDAQGRVAARVEGLFTDLEAALASLHGLVEAS